MLVVGWCLAGTLLAGSGAPSHNLYTGCLGSNGYFYYFKPGVAPLAPCKAGDQPVTLGALLEEGQKHSAGTQQRDESGPRGVGTTSAGVTTSASVAPIMAELQHLQAAVATNPKDVDAWTRLANMYHDAELYSEAVGFYEKADMLRPGDPNVITDLGVCLRGAGQPERALQEFKRAEQIAPSHWQSLFNQVIVYGLDLNRMEDANAALARLEKTKPDAPGLAELRKALEQKEQEPKGSGSGEVRKD